MWRSANTNTGVPTEDDILQTSVNDRISVKASTTNELFQNANRMKFYM